MSDWRSYFPTDNHPARWRGGIAAVTAGYLFAGLLVFAIWLTTGEDDWVEQFFQFPGALLLVTIPACGLWLALRVTREFSKGQSLRTAWQLIAAAAACEFAGAVAVQILNAKHLPDVFNQLALRSGSSGGAALQFGLLAGGPVRFVLLAAGLLMTLRSYRESDLLARFAMLDWAVIAAVGVYIGMEVREVTVAIQNGLRPGVKEMLAWPTDPVLWLLLAEALLLFRSANAMGRGYIGKCWKSVSIGVFLVTLGDFALWAARSGYLPWPWSALEWYVWLPAAAAFAMAPAYQLEAVHHARSGRG